MPIIQKKTDHIEELQEEAKEESYSEEYFSPTGVPIDTSILVSTGCTLLDLAISGGRVRGGGIPGGIMVEIAGGSGSGKTAILTEIGASVQEKGGETRICDPEARLDKEYARIYGMELDKTNYFRPDIVSDVRNDRGKIVKMGLTGLLETWEPSDPSVINLFAADSIAALSCSMEMDGEDKRGQRKAKELSEFCRRTARLIAQEHKLVVLTNQLRDGENGPITPGGHAVPFHASLRITATQKRKISLEKKNSSGKDVKKIVGIETELFIKKSSVDDPYRSCIMYLIFGFGIDDVRGNLQYLKDQTGATSYDCITKSYAAMGKAIAYIEENNLEKELREKVIDIWEENEALFKTERKKKKRF